MGELKRQLTKRRSLRGQSMIEFAFTISIFIVIVFGILEISRLVFMNNMVSNAAREGSHYVALYPTTNLTQLKSTGDFTRTLLLADVNDPNLVIQLDCASCPNGVGVNASDCVVQPTPPCTDNTGESVTVTVTYTWKMLFSLNSIPFINGDSTQLNNGLALVGKSTVGRER